MILVGREFVYKQALQAQTSMCRLAQIIEFKNLQDCSFEHQKQMFKLMNKKIFKILHQKIVYLNICIVKQLTSTQCECCQLQAKVCALSTG